MSVMETVSSGRPLSTKQGAHLCTVLRRHRHLVNAAGVSDTDFDRMLEKPVYRQEPYQSLNIRREVRYLGDNKLGFRAQRDDRLASYIKGVRQKLESAQSTQEVAYHRDARLFVVPVTRHTLDMIIEMIGACGFDTDEGVLEYLTLATNSRGRSSVFAYDEESQQFVVNLCDHELIAACVTGVFGGRIV